MDSGKWKLGQAFGIDVYVHWTFALLPLFVIVQTWQLGGPVVGMLLVLLGCLVLCVVLHEFGHALAGRLLGVVVQDIIITPIGGVARLHGLSARQPLMELVITLAGPAVNLLLAAMFALWLRARNLPMEPQGLESLPQILMWANLAMGIFNLLPAFPMDGGRVLRALLSLVLPFQLATLLAVLLGRAIAVVLVVYGVWSGVYPWAIVGLFVFFAAGAELAIDRERTQ